MVYMFTYGFGPFEGDYVFYLKSNTPYIDEIRLKAIHHCRSLIKKDIEDNLTMEKSYYEAYPDDEDKDIYKYEHEDLTKKLINLEANIDNFVSTGRVNIDMYSGITIGQLEILDL